MVLFITYLRLDTHCTHSFMGTSGKNNQNPHERVLIIKFNQIKPPVYMVSNPAGSFEIALQRMICLISFIRAHPRATKQGCTKCSSDGPDTVRNFGGRRIIIKTCTVLETGINQSCFTLNKRNST